MAKFAVGDKAEIIAKRSKHQLIGLRCEVIAIGPFIAGSVAPDGRGYIGADGDVYVSIENGMNGSFFNSELRKLPGDSTSLPSWLTNMLKVPQGDPDKVKQPEKVK